MYYLNLYFIGAFLGFLYGSFLKNTFFPEINNGILYGPWIPVYGIGVVVTSYISNKSFKLKVNKILRILIFLSLTFVILTLIEEIGGLLIKIFFHKTFWNYRKFRFNLGPYISLVTSFLWCLLSSIFVFYLKPLLELFIKKIPKYFTFGISCLFLVDLFITFLV